MSKVYVLVGLPGAGKSTYARELSKETGAKIFSSDKIREEIGVDGGDSSEHRQVFNILYKRLFGEILRGHDAIFDATNISYKNRVGFIRELNAKCNNVGCGIIEKVCIVIATPYEICLAQNEMRKEAIPSEVIKRMYKNWETPYYSEGWDQIFIHYNKKFYKGGFGSPYSFCIKHKKTDQNNPHHTCTLGLHMLLVANKIGYESDNEDLFYAAMIHDCGKPFTEKKAPDGISHYFQHQNTGAYDALFFDYPPGCDPLYISFIVNQHMKPFSWKENPEGAKKSFELRYGAKELQDILLLNEIDIKAK